MHSSEEFFTDMKMTATVKCSNKYMTEGFRYSKPIVIIAQILYDSIRKE